MNISQNSRVIKRQIFAETSQIFDPLALLSPCIIIAKILLQKLWLEKLAWDESLPYDLHNQWSNYKKQLPALNDLNISRHGIGSNAINIELHGFPDASQEAYLCVYVRSQDKLDNVTIRLFCSKSKVDPLKTQTIPRIELCGAVLLVKLLRKVELALDIPVHHVNYWTDSSIVLDWIKKKPQK